MKHRIRKPFAALLSLGMAASALPAFPAHAAGKQLIHEIRAVTDALPVYGEEAAYFDMQVTEGLPVVIEGCWWEQITDGGSLQLHDQDVIGMEGQYTFVMNPRIPEALSDTYAFAGDLKIYVNDTFMEGYRGMPDAELGSSLRISPPFTCFFEVTKEGTLPIDWSLQNLSIDGSTLSWDAYPGAKSYIFGFAAPDSEMYDEQITDTSIDIDQAIEALCRDVQVDPADMAGQTFSLSLFALDTNAEKGNRVSAEWTGSYVYHGDAPYISSQSPDVVYFVPGTAGVKLFAEIGNNDGTGSYTWYAQSETLHATRGFTGYGYSFPFSGMDNEGVLTAEDDGTVIWCEIEMQEANLTSRKITLRAAALGDANADGSVSMLDVVSVQRFLVRQPSQIHVGLCDFDGDDRITVKDLAMLKSHVTRVLEEERAAQTVDFQYDFPSGFTVGHMIYLSNMQLHYEDARIASTELFMSGSSHVLRTEAGQQNYHIVTGEVYQEGSSYRLSITIHATDEEAAASIAYATLNGSEPVEMDHYSPTDMKAVFDLGYPAAE